jgi:hypothetical protein
MEAANAAIKRAGSPTSLARRLANLLSLYAIGAGVTGTF